KAPSSQTTRTSCAPSWDSTRPFRCRSIDGGCQMEYRRRRQPVAPQPASKKKNRNRRKTGGKADPDAAPRKIDMEGKQRTKRQANAPVADRAIEHRDRGVMKPAQHAGGDCLRPIEVLERCREGQEGDRKGNDLCVGGIGGID